MKDDTATASRERGAAAVEFALVAPLLVLLVLGSIEFGWFFFSQANVANAAREGAREMAISNNVSTARTTAVNAAQPTPVKVSDVAILPSSCSPGTNAKVTITVVYDALTGMFGQNFTATGTGVMRCGG